MTAEGLAAPEVVAVVGPTASGKTRLGIELAETLGTEIISTDSMQFYRGMAIGTSAPTAEEQARVRHHFVGFLNPDESYSAGQFQGDAREVVAGLNAQGKPAVVVGGAGLYVRALIDGLFSGPAKDEPIRERLHAEAEEVGVAGLYARLESVDGAYAAVIDPNDLRRIVRALEVYEVAGRPVSEFYDEQEDVALCAVQLAIDWPRDVLYERINARVDQMMAEGFLDEVRALLDAGYETALERLKPLGYREMMSYLRGECSLEDAVEQMKQGSRRYAKRQLTWFRADERIHWLRPGNANTLDESVLFQAKQVLADAGLAV